MKILCLMSLFHASLQLQCDKRDIAAHVGDEFILACKYDTNRFMYSKKYWCRGDSRGSCEILVDSEGFDKTKRRAHVVDAGRRGLFVKVTHLHFDDSGVYWVGIDKIYADVMTSVNVVITEVPVSKPRLWPLSSLVDRPTCWGQPVTVRCGCTYGTGIRYAWYQRTHHEDLLLQPSSDLCLHCGAVEKDADYYCIASNDVSRQESDILSVQILMPADNSCIYVVHFQDQPSYDCVDRMSTTTAKTPPLTTNQATVKIHTDSQPLRLNHTYHHHFTRLWTGVPLWYALLRWGSFASLLICLCVVCTCTKQRHRKCTRRKRRVHFTRVPHLVQ